MMAFARGGGWGWVGIGRLLAAYHPGVAAWSWSLRIRRGRAPFCRGRRQGYLLWLLAARPGLVSCALEEGVSERGGHGSGQRTIWLGGSRSGGAGLSSIGFPGKSMIAADREIDWRSGICGGRTCGLNHWR